MSVTLNQWNILDHLKTEEDMRLYLEACFEEGADDAEFIANALNDVAKAQYLLKEQKGIKPEKATLSEQENSSLLAGLKLINALGLKLHVEYPKTARRLG